MSSISKSAIKQVNSKVLFIEGNSIDTDRIIPARFLKSLTVEHLGNHCFEDDRKDATQKGEVHPLDQDQNQGRTVLLVEKDFGCGSSREHAPIAIQRWGIKAIIGQSFGEIFRGNCGSLGMPCVVISDEVATDIKAMLTSNPELELTLDLEQRKIHLADQSFDYQLNEAISERLVSGKWDSLSELLQNQEAAKQIYQQLPYLNFK